MSKQKTYYKCVTKDMKSGYVDNLKELCTTYQLNKWTYPILKKSKLFVFDNKNTAKNWARADWLDVYECEVKNPTKHGPFDLSVRLEEILYLWKLYKNKKAYKRFSDELNHGVILAEAVKLTKLIKSY